MARRGISGHGRILLAEDNASNQRLFETILTGAGFIVDTVENGALVLEALSQNSYDLILMDGQMPVLGGIETTMQIRSSTEIYSDIPIIALTANTMSGDREKYLAAGMNDFVSKPIDFEDFFKKIAALLENRNTH